MLKNVLVTTAVLAATMLGGADRIAAQEIKAVRYATESWGGFTNKDGSGLYHELFRKVFAEFGVKVKVTYVPLKRAIAIVTKGQADFTGGFKKDTRNFSKYPVFETSVSALLINSLKVDWSNAKQVRKLRLVGPPELAKTSGLPVTEVDSRWQAATMVLKGRADAYVDLTPILIRLRDTGQLIASPQEISPGTRSIDFGGKVIKIESVRLTQLHMLFSDTHRGHKIRELYEEGTRRLAADGRLKALYARYKFQTPTIK